MPGSICFQAVKLIYAAYLYVQEFDIVLFITKSSTEAKSTTAAI